MQAVLYIGHGSRVKEAAAEAVQFMEKTMELVDVPIQEYCFLELSKPDIFEGVKQCVERGATSIAVVPVLLLTAAHAKQDIPEELAVARKKYPKITFTYGRPLGVHDMIIDVLIEKVMEKEQITEEMDILLVGRGSSDQEQIRDINIIANRLYDRTGVHSVQTCYLAAAHPRFQKKVKEMEEKGAKHVVILPYLLFTGILMREILKTVKQLNLSPEQKFTVCEYIGDHNNLCYLLKERVIETIELKTSSDTELGTAVSDVC